MFKQTKSSKYISKSTSSWHKLSLFCNLFLGVENENPLNQPVNTCSSSAVYYGILLIWPEKETRPCHGKMHNPTPVTGKLKRLLKHLRNSHRFAVRLVLAYFVLTVKKVTTFM